MDDSNKEDPENSSESLILKINGFLAARKYKHAWRHSKELVLNEPNNNDYVVLQIQILFKQKRYNMAEEFISNLKDIGGNLESVSRLSEELKELREIEEKTLPSPLKTVTLPAPPAAVPVLSPSWGAVEHNDLALISENYEEKREYSLYKRIAALFLERLSSINALVYLQIKTKYNSRKMGFASALLIPFLTITMMYVIFAVIRKRQPGDMSIEVFILSGMSAWLIFLGSMNVFNDLMRKSPNPMKMHAVVNSFDVCIANIIMGILPIIAVSVFIVIGLFMTDIQIEISNLPMLLLSILGSVLFGCSAGVIFGVLSLYTEVFLNLRTIFTRALFLTSGIFFSIDELPSNIYSLIRFVPLVHLIEGVRFSLSSTYPAESMSLPFAFGIISVILIAAMALNGVRRRYKEL